MKNRTIKTPTTELLIVEVPNSWGLTIGEEALLIYDHTKKVFGKTYTFNGYYTLLGKPDEISEEDATKLFYNPIDSANLTHYANLRNLFSLIESEIYWENPLANDVHAPDIEEWKEAEEKTFDRNRSLIFVKN